MAHLIIILFILTVCFHLYYYYYYYFNVLFVSGRKHVYNNNIDNDKHIKMFKGNIERERITVKLTMQQVFAGLNQLNGTQFIRKSVKKIAQKKWGFCCCFVKILVVFVVQFHL